MEHRLYGIESLLQASQAEVELLVKASAALLASPRAGEVLSTIFNLAQTFVDCDAYAVWQRSEDGDEWRLVLGTGLSQSYERLFSVRTASNFRIAEPISVEDVQADPWLAQRADFYVAEGIRSMLVVPLQRAGCTGGTVVFYYRNPHRFTEAEKRIANTLGNLASSALANAEFYEREVKSRQLAEVAQQRTAFLAKAGEVLASSLDYDETLATVAKLCVPFFADWCSVEILQASGQSERLVVEHCDPAKVALAQEYTRRYPLREDDALSVAMRTGKSLLREDVPDSVLVKRARDAEHLELMRSLQLRSVIITPLIARGRTLGAITFVTAESGRRYTAEDLAYAEELARRTAIAVDNARLFEQAQSMQHELERSNEDLRRANQDLESFAYSASHDLQEPLRSVALLTRLLRRQLGGKLDAETAKLADAISEGVGRMNNLLRDLLAYCRAAQPTPGAVPTIEAGLVLKQVIDNLKVPIEQSGAVIEAKGLPRIRIHDIHLTQLLQNLISNAIKYRGADPPRIQIVARNEASNWKFWVSDNGIGIAAQYHKQIFGLFKRLHGQECPGSGIGLAICQRIAERYDGRVWLDESEPGKGSVFCFEIPHHSLSA